MTRGIQQRLVALDVDDDAAGQRSGHLGQPIGPAFVVGPRHPGRAAESLDRSSNALVVGGDDHGVDQPGLGCPPVDVFDHRSSGDVGEDFGGEAG